MRGKSAFKCEGVVYVGKLSDKERKKIIAEYVAGDGKVSIRALAKKYSVSPTSISKILEDKKSVQKCTHKKKENEMSMLAFLDDRAGKAKELIDKILETLPNDFEKSSMRDKAGLLKILTEVFTPKDGVEDSGEDEGIVIEIRDYSNESDNTT